MIWTFGLMERKMGSRLRRTRLSLGSCTTDVRSTANIRESSVFFRTSLTTWKVACSKKAHQFREVYDYLDVIDWPFCCRPSHISEIVFAGILATFNKRGEGPVSGCTLLNGFFVLYVTFFLQCGKDKDAEKCDRRKKNLSHTYRPLILLQRRTYRSIAPRDRRSDGLLVSLQRRTYRLRAPLHRHTYRPAVFTHENKGYIYVSSVTSLNKKQISFKIKLLHRRESVKYMKSSYTHVVSGTKKGK